MKFLCIPCDSQMSFEERQQPGDGTFGASFSCPKCGYRVAMLANPMETQLVESLGVKIGGRALDGVPAPMELVRERMVGREDAFQDDERTTGRPAWSPESEERLLRVPKFVRGMVKRVYGDWAAERGITLITPEIMDEARVDLGLEHM